ncbi:hypothetical protein [Agrobacterium sp. 22-223-1]
MPAFGKLFSKSKDIGFCADAPLFALKVSGALPQRAVGAAVNANLVTEDGMRGRFTQSNCARHV